MKINHRMTIGLTLTLAIVLTIGLVNALDIGTTMQLVPFEASPTATLTGSSTSGVTTPTAAWDTSLGTFTNIRIAAAAAVNNTFYGVMNFEEDISGFAIGWVDIKLLYSVAGGGATATSDDMYRIEYTTVAAPVAGDWMPLVPNSQGATSNVAIGAATIGRNWFNQLPNDGVWDWTDIVNLKIRVFRILKGSLDTTTHVMRLYETWVTVYPTTVPLPPAGPSVSIQPPAIDALAVPFNDVFFIDIYARDFTAFAGYQVRVNFNTTVLTPIEAWTYYPFNGEAAAPVLEDALGYVEIAYLTFFGDAVGFTGTTPIARIYFMLDEDPLLPGSGLPPTPNFSWLKITISKMSDTTANPIVHPVSHGWYGTPPANTRMFASVGTDLANPISTQWIEQTPDPGMHWHMTSWEDQGDLILSPSDQVDMTDELSRLEWFHVEEVWQVDQGATVEPKAGFIGTIKGAVPEFPMGLGILMMIAPAIAVAYLWRSRKKVTKQ